MKELGMKWKGLDNNEKMMYGGEIDDSRSFLTRCSLKLVACSIRFQRERKKKVVQEIGFGSLIRRKRCPINRKLVLWLVNQFYPFSHTLELHGTVYPISSVAVHWLMGLLGNGNACDDTDDTYTLDEMKKKYKLGEG